MGKLYETFGRELLNGKRFAYDGEKTLFAVGPLTFNSHRFPVHLDAKPGRGRFVRRRRLHSNFEL